MSMLGTVAELAEEHAMGWADRGLVPDFLLRRAIRALLGVRKSSLATASGPSLSSQTAYKYSYIASLDAQPIAILMDKANEQHYEVSTEFLQSCLGPRMKYSSCLYDEENGELGASGGKEAEVRKQLADAEVRMLEVYCERAKLEDGMDILDLGCGWGSLCLFLAEKYPNARIHALSNSSTQKKHIDSMGFSNLTVYTGDVRIYDFPEDVRFDRILSIEMLEHMKNYRLLFSKISSWLKPNSEARGASGSLFFAHIFCHKDTPYHFEESDGWMAKMFFSGGTMPSFDLFTYFQQSMTLEHSWYINGQHYARTLEDWLLLQDASNQSGSSIRLLEKDAAAKGVDAEEGAKSLYRFRIFFMACAELFGYEGGETWGVGHYLFKKRD